MTSIQGYLFKLYLRYMRITHPPKEGYDLAMVRDQQEKIATMFKPLAAFSCEPMDINGVPAEWITPSQVSDRRTILYLHGGYYMIGSIHSHRNLAGNIAASAHAKTLIIDYRLAPEHPFPAGLEDTLTAYHWLLAQGIYPHQIYLAGDSAGGGMVLSTLLALHQRGLPFPAAGICISPCTNISMSGESWKFNAKRELVVDPYMAKQIAPLYLRETNFHDPLASPLFGDLHGLPPLLIQVGSEEALLSDSLSFVDRAKNAGVDVKLEVWPGMYHVWHYTASMVPEGRQAIEKIAEFIKAVSATIEN